MENLFATHRPTRTYDLKGIATRVAKVADKGVKAEVLWDVRALGPVFLDRVSTLRHSPSGSSRATWSWCTPIRSG